MLHYLTVLWWYVVTTRAIRLCHLRNPVAMILHCMIMLCHFMSLLSGLSTGASVAIYTQDSWYNASTASTTLCFRTLRMVGVFIMLKYLWWDAELPREARDLASWVAWIWSSHAASGDWALHCLHPKPFSLFNKQSQSQLFDKAYMLLRGLHYMQSQSHMQCLYQVV